MDLSQKDIIDPALIKDLIPQKHPFVMVDKLLHYEDKKVVAGLTVAEENLFMDDGKFTAPGIIEHMAQTVALYTGYQYYLKKQPAPIGYIGAIKKASIFWLPSTGDQLVTTVKVLHDIMGVTLVTASTFCGRDLLATSEMK